MHLEGMLHTSSPEHNPLQHNFAHCTCRFLWFPPEQHPIVCQLGGSNPTTLAAAAKVVAKYGYDEINLNCGCPSERVAGAGCFGAAMMLQPHLVAQCCQAMQEAVPDIPITVKCRLGDSCCPRATLLPCQMPALISDSCQECTMLPACMLLA